MKLRLNFERPIMFILMIILVAIAAITDGCYMVLPREFQKVHPKLIWAIVSAGVLQIVATALGENVQPISGLLSLAGFILYALFRGIAFLGLNASFKAYFRENGMYRSPVGTVWAWLASVLDILGIGALIAVVLVRVMQEEQETPFESAAYTQWTFVVLSGGLFFTFAFLIVMCSNKNKVIAMERAERKKMTDLLLIERKKQRDADKKAPASVENAAQRN